MIWRDVEKFYGTEIANCMKESKWLQNVTVTAVLPNGKEAMYEDVKAGRAEWDFPESDLENAYRAVTGLKVRAESWD